MNKFMIFLFIILPLRGVDLSISVSGLYGLAGNIESNPSLASDAIIYISASNVTLDLQDCMLTQQNSTAGVRAIEIAAGSSNITIKNGLINNVTGTGILINQNCTHITIENMQIVSAQTRGIDAAGSVGNQIQDLIIINTDLLQCSLGSSADIALNLTEVNRPIIKNCTINSSGNAANNFTALSCSAVSNGSFFDVSCTGNVGLSFVGFLCNASTNCLYRRCLVRNNSATNAMSAFDCNGSSAVFTLFDHCIAMNNSAGSAASAQGFYLEANAQDNILLHCLAWNQSGDTAYGFYLTGGTANNLRNMLIGCRAMAQQASGSGVYMVGTYINGSADGLVMNGLAADGSSSSGNAYGILFDSAGADNWSVINNRAIRNNGSASNRSYGLADNAGGTVVYSRNIGFNNGTRAANQLRGLPSVTRPGSPATSNLNSSSYNSWTNMAISQ